MADEFCLKMPDFHVTFRDLIHAVNLRHGTDGFTSPPEEGVLSIFSPWKIQRLRSGLNQRTWVPKASTLPLDHRSRLRHLHIIPPQKKLRLTALNIILHTYLQKYIIIKRTAFLPCLQRHITFKRIHKRTLTGAQQWLHMKIPYSKGSRTRLQWHRFIRHLVYSVTYSVAPINSSLLTKTLN